MRNTIPTLFAGDDMPGWYFSPEEATDTAFADPGDMGLNVVEYLQSQSTDDTTATDDTPGLAPKTELQEQGEKLTDADEAARKAKAKAQAQEPEDEPEEKEEPPKEVKTEAKEEPKEEPKATEASPSQIEALQAACDALGITATDPIAQAAALKAHAEQQKATREQEAQARNEARQRAAEESWKKGAEDATREIALNQMQRMGYDTSVPNWWDDTTWANTDDPAYGRTMLQVFNDIVSAPEVRAFYDSHITNAKTVHEAREAKVSQVLDTYKGHVPSVAQLMRENNVDPSVIETVARAEDAHVKAMTATTNSALTAAQAELASLRETVSGYDAAIAKAKQDGIDEGRRLVTEEIAAGKRLPNSVGLGSTSADAYGPGVFDDPGEFTYKEAMAGLARNGRH